MSEAGGINPWLNASIIAGGWYLGSPQATSMAVTSIARTIHGRVDWRKVIGVSIQVAFAEFFSACAQEDEPRLIVLLEQEILA